MLRRLRSSGPNAAGSLRMRDAGQRVEPAPIADNRGTIFKRADLSRANCQDAVLHKTDLSEAILGRANLSYADFSEANLQESIFVSQIVRRRIWQDAKSIVFPRGT